MKKIALLLMLIATLSGCAKSDRMATIAKQEESIDKYIESTFPNKEVVRNNGSTRVVIEHRLITDVLVEPGDSVYFSFAGFVFNNSPSQLFDTNVKALAEASGFVLDDPDYGPKKVCVNRHDLIDGLYNGMTGMKPGEHAIILFSAQYGFYNKKVYNIPRLSALAYEIWVEKVIKKQK